MTTTLKDVRRAARKLNATVEESNFGDSHECSVTAPDGMLWNEGDVHQLLDACYRPWKPDYTDLLSRMKHGLRPCEDAECDWCERQGASQ